MRNTRKLAAVAAIAALTAASLAACGSSKRETTAPTSSGGSTSPTDGTATLKDAASILAAAGVATPVTLSLQYNPDHYGDSSDQEYGLIKQQLEATGLFKVELQSTEWTTYAVQRVDDYPLYQLGWYPDFPDPDNYLTPFFEKENFLVNRFDDATVQALLAKERTDTNPETRAATIEETQVELAKHLSTLPLLQGRLVSVASTAMTGVEETMDASFQLRFPLLQKDGDPNAIVKIGTTDKVTALDPAYSYDNASYLVQYNVYPMLMAFKPGEVTPQPEMAESCEFSADGMQLTCKLRQGLKWANGHTLDSADVKFTYDRQQVIADPNGPSSLLANLESTEAPDPYTVVFNLKSPNDVTFTQVLASPVGPIVDDEVFSATEITESDAIVAANAFAGPYRIVSFEINEVVEYEAYSGYSGIQPAPQNGGIVMTYYKESNNMRLDIESGEIDVVWRSLTATDYEALEQVDTLKVLYGPGGEIRYIVFNLETMPGDTPEQKLAIRQAIAASIDRTALSEEVYKGTYMPLCSYVPDGLPGANKAVCDAYGGE
jgi:ABC-type transport system substrate-binding protein